MSVKWTKTNGWNNITQAKWKAKKTTNQPEPIEIIQEHVDIKQKKFP